MPSGKYHDHLYDIMPLLRDHSSNLVGPTEAEWVGWGGGKMGNVDC